MIKKIISIILIILCLTSNIYALTLTELLKYKGSNIIVVENSSVIPYTIKGLVIDIVTTEDSRYFLMLQTTDYDNYDNGIAFINITNIIAVYYN